jgi:conjugative transfer signal peptidase TraF
MGAAVKTARTIMIAGALIALADAGTHAILQAAHLHFNYTKSVAVGLYRETSKQRSSYAGFCLPRTTIERAIRAGMDPIPGTCPGGVAPILKPLIEATPERPVVFSKNGFSVAGKLLPNTLPKSTSRAGMPLAHYEFGTYTRGLWAVSSFSPDSYDSRYFGPIDPASVQFYSKPVLTF